MVHDVILSTTCGLNITGEQGLTWARIAQARWFQARDIALMEFGYIADSPPLVWSVDLDNPTPYQDGSTIVAFTCEGVTYDVRVRTIAPDRAEVFAEVVR